MAVTSLLATGCSVAPYPGLRPFRRSEADIFFGREEQTDQLLTKLQRCRFLAVVGPSGCGKSSLVRAGMIAALESGFMVDAGAHWRIVEMRPGDRPLEAMADALLAPWALGPERPDEPAAAPFLRATLRRGPLGLVEALRETPLPEGTNLLLLVDQFEEIFRFRQHGDANEAEAFVSLLVATAEQQQVPVYVVITMRSDFLGDCALFTGLPEAINDSQYLTPRLTREQSAAAITGPARVFGGDVDPALVNRLLNDMGPDPDQLPVLQHALMRMWNRAASAGRSTLALDDYEAIGGLAEALSRHADEALAELDEEQQRIAQVLFRDLTERGADQRDTRRPARLGEIAAVAEVSPEQVAAVVEVFRRTDRCFVTPPAEAPLHPESVLDIGHESLIRQWQLLNGWVKEEAQSADYYRFIVQSARSWKAGEAGLWGMPNLDRAWRWKERQKPTRAWATRYGNPEEFERAMEFLDTSEQRWGEENELRSKENERRLELEARARKGKRFRQLAAWSLTIIAVETVLVGVALENRKEAVRSFRQATRSAAAAQELRRRAQENAEQAAYNAVLFEQQKTRAEASARESLLQKQRAEALAAEAQRLRRRAQANEVRAVRSARAAEQQRKRAEASALEAQRLRSLAEANAREAEEQRATAESRLGKLQHAYQSLRMAYQAAGTAFSPDGRSIATGTADGTVALLNAETGTRDATLRGPDYPVTSASFSPDSRLLAAGYQNGKIVLWDVSTRRALRAIDGTVGSVRKVTFSPDSRYLASAGDDGTCRLWDAATGVSIRSWPAGKVSLVDLSFSPDGKTVIATGANGTTYRWDVRTGSTLH